MPVIVEALPLVRGKRKWSWNCYVSVRKIGTHLVHQKRLRGVMPGSWCDHDYLIEVHVYDRGRRARCLRCLAVGPVREDAHAARQALVERKRGKQ